MPNHQWIAMFSSIITVTFAWANTAQILSRKILFRLSLFSYSFIHACTFPHSAAIKHHPTEACCSLLVASTAALPEGLSLSLCLCLFLTIACGH